MNSYLEMIRSVSTRHDAKIKKATNAFCEYFDISQFWYNKIDDKGFLASLSNHPSWTEYFASEKLFLRCPQLRHSDHLKNGISIPSNDEVEEFLSLNIVRTFYREDTIYDGTVWFVLTKKTDCGAEQFGFLTKKRNTSLIINELNLIKAFVNALPKSLEDVFSKLLDSQINLLDLIGPSFYENPFPNSSHHSPESRRLIIEELGGKEMIQLKPKEIEVLSFVLKGFSASAIAPQVFLAKRTVEHVLERIKDKLCCNSKTELIKRASEIQELGYFECQGF